MQNFKPNPDRLVTCSKCDIPLMLSETYLIPWINDGSAFCYDCWSEIQQKGENDESD